MKKQFLIHLFIILMMVCGTCSAATTSTDLNIMSNESEMLGLDSHGADNGSLSDHIDSMISDWQNGLIGKFGKTEKNLSGNMSTSENAVDLVGRMVNFSIINSTIVNYTVYNELLFDAISSNWTDFETTTTGSVAKLSTDLSDVQIHDNPTGLLKIISHVNQTITFLLSSNVTAELMNNCILISDENIEAVILGVYENQVLLNNKTITINSDQNGAILVRVMPVQEELRFTHREQYQHMINAIIAGNVGAEVMVQRINGTFEKDVIGYADMNITVNATLGKIFSTVNCSQHDADYAKTLIFRCDNNTLDPEKALRVLYDGDLIQEASSLEDVLDPHDDELPEYYVLNADNETYVYVSIPHFSEHTISIETVAEIVQNVPVLVIGAALVIVIVAAVALFRRTR